MPAENATPKLAVLIDADNTSADIADALFAEIAKIGEASVRRIYGDFSGTRLKAWTAVLPEHAIIAHQNFAHTAGKNASDIALVIDAMDLLHSHRFDGFCLVSSDSDFTRLASRIREEGVDVYGFGKQQTPKSFRQACRRFIFTENLVGAAQEAGQAGAPRKALESPANAVPILARAMAELEDEDGWVSLGGLGSRVQAMEPDFDPRTYGHAKLSKLVEKSGAFEIDAGDAQNLRVRLKPAAPKRRRRRASAPPPPSR